MDQRHTSTICIAAKQLSHGAIRYVSSQKWNPSMGFNGAYSQSSVCCLSSVTEKENREQSAKIGNSENRATVWHSSHSNKQCDEAYTILSVKGKAVSLTQWWSDLCVNDQAAFNFLCWMWHWNWQVRFECDLRNSNPVKHSSYAKHFLVKNLSEEWDHRQGWQIQTVTECLHDHCTEARNLGRCYAS